MNIPIAEVPNAPSGLGNAPRMPEGIARLDRPAQMPVLRASMLGGEARGIGAIGQAIGDAGARVGDSALRFLEARNRANDAVQFTEAERIKRNLLTQFEVESSTKPENEHAELWADKYQPQFQQQVSELPFSQGRQAEVGAWFRDQTSAINSGILKEANRKHIERQAAYMDNEHLDALNQGRYDEAIGILVRAEQAQILPPKYVQRRIAEIENTMVVNDHQKEIAVSPYSQMKEISELVSKGESIKGISFEQTNALLRQARYMHGQALQDATNAVIDRMDSQPEITDAKSLKEQMDAEPQRVRFPVELRDKILNAWKVRYDETPKGRAEKSERFSSLWSAIFKYDADNDLTKDKDHLSGYSALVERILSDAPEGQRKLFLDELNGLVGEARKGKRSNRQQMLSFATEKVNSLAKWGLLGDNGGWKDSDQLDANGKPVRMPADYEKYEAVQAKRYQIISSFREWTQKNPDATPEEAKKKIDELTAPYKPLQDASNNESWLWSAMRAIGNAAGSAGGETPARTFRNIREQKENIEKNRDNATPRPFGSQKPSGKETSLLDWMKKEEGFRPKAYADSGQTSVGYGTRGKPGEVLDERQATERLQSELAMHTRNVNEAARKNGVTLTTSMRDALISFDFNTGAAAKVMSSGTPEAIARRMALYVHADAGAKDGVLKGRRERELEVFWRDGGKGEA